MAPRGGFPRQGRARPRLLLDGRCVRDRGAGLLESVAWRDAPLSLSGSTSRPRGETPRFMLSSVNQPEAKSNGTTRPLAWTAHAMPDAIGIRPKVRAAVANDDLVRRSPRRHARGRSPATPRRRAPSAPTMPAVAPAPASRRTSQPPSRARHSSAALRPSPLTTRGPSRACSGAGRTHRRPRPGARPAESRSGGHGRPRPGARRFKIIRPGSFDQRGGVFVKKPRRRWSLRHCQGASKRPAHRPIFVIRASSSSGTYRVA